jgi:hypothetical protein
MSRTNVRCPESEKWMTESNVATFAKIRGFAFTVAVQNFSNTRKIEKIRRKNKSDRHQWCSPACTAVGH